MKYNVLKTPCDTVIIFAPELFWGYLGVFLILRRAVDEYLGGTGMATEA